MNTISFDLTNELQVIALAQLLSEFVRQSVNPSLWQSPNGLSVTVKIEVSK